MVKKFILALLGFLTLSGLLFTSCAPSDDGSGGGGSVGATDTGPWIFISSGTTYAGNAVTMSTPIQVVSRYSIDGTFQKLVRDYSTSTGDTPTGLADYDDDEIAVLVENTGGRKIEFVKKDGSGVTGTITLPAITPAAQIARHLTMSSDGTFLIAKTAGVEKYTTAGSRITGAAAGPYINTGAGTGSCATSNTLVVAVEEGPSGSIFYAHAAASANNQVSIVASGGYFVVGDCLGAEEGPTANHYPTALLYHSSGDMLVGYGNNTGPVHQIYAYDAAANSLTGDTLAFNNTSVLQGINFMAEMSDGTILVSAAASTFNVIEKLSYDSGTKTLTRVGSSPFIGPTLYTRAPSAILITD